MMTILKSDRIDNTRLIIIILYSRKQLVVRKNARTYRVIFLPRQKPHRLLPNNLYVVLYNFKARREDELDLK